VQSLQSGYQAEEVGLVRGANGTVIHSRIFCSYTLSGMSEVNTAVEKVFSDREGDALLLIASELFYSSPKTLYEMIPIFPAIREAIWRVMFTEGRDTEIPREKLKAAFKEEIAGGQIRPALEVTGCFSR
jgi:hypothetical protein